MDKTFVAGCVCVTVVLLGITAGVTYANVNKQRAVADMVAKGADPQAVYCALDGVNASNQQVCVTLATKVGTK